MKHNIIEQIAKIRKTAQEIEQYTRYGAEPESFEEAEETANDLDELCEDLRYQIDELISIT